MTGAQVAMGPPRARGALEGGGRGAPPPRWSRPLSQPLSVPSMPCEEPLCAPGKGEYLRRGAVPRAVGPCHVPRDRAVGSLLSTSPLLSPQGGLLDNVEQHVMHTAEHVELANEQTKKALHYQGQARKVGGCQHPWVLSVSPPPLFLSSLCLRPAAPAPRREP